MAKTKEKPAPAAPLKTQLRIEYMPLSQLKRAPRNAKLHNDAALKESFGWFGFVAPIIMDERTGQLVAGHGRLDSLIAEKDAGKPAPERITAKDGEWLVPVLRGVAFKDEAAAEAYLLADNQLTISGGYDEKALLGQLQSLMDSATGDLDALMGTGFDMEAFKELERSVAAAGGATDPNGEWNGMPEFDQQDKTAFRSITIHFRDQSAVDQFAKAVNKPITPHTRYLWFPEIEIETYMDKAYTSDSEVPDLHSVER